MPLDWQILSTKNFSGGEDSRSAPSAIEEGFLERALNVETNPKGWVATRPGYELYHGYVPLRVTKVIHSGDNIDFKIETSEKIDLSSVSSSPILVYGQLSSDGSAATGDFVEGTNNLRYYPSFSLNNTITYTTGDTTEDITSDDHGISSADLFVGAALQTDLNNRSNEVIVPDEITINRTNFTVTLDYVPAVDEIVYPYFLDASAVAGTSHKTSVTAQTTVTITSATHGLNSYNIIPKCYDTSSGANVEVIPDGVTIDTAGEVILTFSAAFTGDILLYAPSTAQSQSVSASAGSNTFTITGATSPFAFFAIYAWTGSLFEMVLPDQITFDDLTDTFSIDYFLGASSETVEIYWEYGTPISNRIRVTDTAPVSESYTDDTPQLTLWGIPHAGIYRDGQAGGHVTHVDTYTRTAESRAVCAVGGVVCAARTRGEVGVAYGMPLTFAALRGRVSTAATLAPLFSDASNGRTRGNAIDASVSDNYAVCTEVAYVSSGLVRYTLAFTNKSGTNISSAASTSDYLTVTGVPHAEYNGTFKIAQFVSESATAAVIEVENSAAHSAAWNQTGMLAKAGVFSDQFNTSTDPHFIPGDRIVAESIPNNLTLSVLAGGPTTQTVSGVTSAVTLPAGLLVFANRTTDVIPLRNSLGTRTVTNYVRGDVLDVSTLDNHPKIKSINPAENNTITSISVTDGIATATTAAHGLSAGQRILIASCSESHNGTHTVLAVPTATTFTFASTGDVASDGVLVGKTIHIDESIAIADGLSSPTSFGVHGRWIPIEAPTTTGDLPAPTTLRHFDFDGSTEQAAIKSTIISDSMFFTNQRDEVMKFDGTNIYRAGLPSWQPQLFLNVDTSASSLVNNNPKVVLADAVPAGNVLTTAKGSGFQLYDRISNSHDSLIFTVTGVTTDNTKDYITVAEALDGATYLDTDTIQRIARRRYYLRVRAFDSNNNVVASAATGTNDLIAEISDSAVVKIRAVGFPVFEHYNYDRLELDVFGTLLNAQAPFYKIATLPLSFSAGYGYVDIVDNVIDEVLTDRDEISTTLLGVEVGPFWDQPLRAKYITATDNRLILSNLKDYPELDITLRRKGESGSVAVADLAGLRWLFRKSNTDTATITNMTDRIGFEFLSGSAATDTFADEDVTTGAGSSTITLTGHTFTTGQRIRLTTSGVLPTGLALATDYWIIRIDGDTVKLATSYDNAVAGTFVTISAASGGGTHTATRREVLTLTPNTDLSYDGADLVVSSTAHGLVAGNWIYLYHHASAENNGLKFAGWWQVKSAATDTFTVDYTSSTHTPASTDITRIAIANDPRDLPVFLGADYNYGYFAGNPSTSYEDTAMMRLAAALNAAQRMTDTSVSTTFTPWLTAAAGSDYNVGQLKVRSPLALSTTPELVLDTISGTAKYEVYINNILRASEEEVSATTRLFPSRAIVSYSGYPEIFDNPQGDSRYSTAALEVNAEDGQEITMSLPFFGASVFSDSRGEAMVAVFKSGSIHVMNPATGAVQKVEQPYGGCTAPKSVCQTRKGIIFANESGVYRLNNDLTVDRVGANLQREWQNNVNKDYMVKIAGHNYTAGNKYKLSIPYGSNQTTNNYYFSYEFTREEEGGLGAWTRADNHNALGWANLGKESLWASTEGEVFKVRNTSTRSDYRDDEDAISIDIITRAEDFGVTSRKSFGGVNLEFHTDLADLSGISVSTSTDLSADYHSAGTLSVTNGSDYRLVQAWFSVKQRKGNRIQARIQNSTKDVKTVFAGMSVKVAGIGPNKMSQSRDFS